MEESSFFTSPAEADFSVGITGATLLYESQSGYCRVWVARHFGRKVAIKGLKEAMKTEPVAVTALEKEFSLGFPVDTPRVCRFLGMIKLADGTRAIEMEYCEGRTLAEIIDSSTPLSAHQAGVIVTGVLEGIEALHRSGVIHRDIKPTNIIVDFASYSVKIIDLGCAYSTDYPALSGPAGTRRYTPPDKLKPGRRAVPADDLYAAGVTFQEMAGLMTDKASRRRVETLAADLIDGRYQTGADALASFLANPPSRWRRHRTVAIFPAIAAAILIGALIYVLTRTPQPELSGATEPTAEPDSTVAAVPHISDLAQPIGEPAQPKAEPGTVTPPPERKATTPAAVTDDSFIIRWTDSVFTRHIMPGIGILGDLQLTYERHRIPEFAQNLYRQYNQKLLAAYRRNLGHDPDMELMERLFTERAVFHLRAYKKKPAENCDSVRSKLD